MALLTGRRMTVYTSNYVMSIPAGAAGAAAAVSTVSTGEATSLSQPQFTDQTANREPTAFYRNKGKHAKSPERFFSAIKTPTPSPAPVSGSRAASLSTPSQAPPLLKYTPSPEMHPPPASQFLSSFFSLYLFLSSCIHSV